MPTPKANPIDPPYYHRTLADGHPITEADVTEAFFAKDPHRSRAFKYMGRAGEKDPDKYVEDLEKCKWWIDRAIAFHQSKLRKPMAKGK